MTVFLVYVAAAAVLLAFGFRGVKWLAENVQLTWWPQQRPLPDSGALRSP